MAVIASRASAVRPARAKETSALLYALAGVSRSSPRTAWTRNCRGCSPTSSSPPATMQSSSPRAPEAESGPHGSLDLDGADSQIQLRVLRQRHERAPRRSASVCVIRIPTGCPPGAGGSALLVMERANLKPDGQRCAHSPRTLDRGAAGRHPEGARHPDGLSPRDPDHAGCSMRFHSLFHSLGEDCPVHIGVSGRTCRSRKTGTDHQSIGGSNPPSPSIQSISPRSGSEPGACVMAADLAGVRQVSSGHRR